MKIVAFLLLAAFSIFSVQADDNANSPPVAIRQPEPVYAPELSTSFLINPTKVTMIIDDRGIPFSLSASALPDNVVTALSEWRYRPGRKDGSNVPFSLTFIMAVRSRLDPAIERSLRRRSYYPSKVVAKALDSGTGLDFGAAEGLERDLTVNFNNIDNRAQLLLYSLEAASTNTKDAAERRARHIEFLVQNVPDDPILAAPFTAVNTTAGPLVDPDAYSRLRDIWLKQLPMNPDDPATLEHATYFLRINDPERTEKLLLPAARVLPDASIWLGELYGLALLGVNGIDLKTGLAVSAPSILPATPFAQRARAALLATNDVKTLISAVNAFAEHGRALATLDALPHGYDDLCSQLLTRVKQFYPASAISCDPSAKVPESLQTATRIRVGGNVQQAQLIKKTIPVYPLEAKAIGLQGTVRFSAVIDKDGSIADLSLVSGPLLLYKSARDAVSKWIYRPTLLNGNPVQVVTSLEVNYTLSR